MSDFSARVDAFLAELFRLNPTFATAMGEHVHDARWPDLTSAGRAEQLAFIVTWLAEFRAMADLSVDDAIDRDLLIGELEAARFGETELCEDAWNPLEWVYLVGNGLFTAAINTGNEFGGTAFDSSARWLQVAVRSPAGAGVFTTLAGRQPITVRSEERRVGKECRL